MDLIKILKHRALTFFQDVNTSILMGLKSPMTDDRSSSLILGLAFFSRAFLMTLFKPMT